MNTAVVAVLITACCGLTGTVVAGVLARRTSKETLGLDTLRLALTTQAAQLTAQAARLGDNEQRIDQQDRAIQELEGEVRACHIERDADRRSYQEQLDQLRRQIGSSR